MKKFPKILLFIFALVAIAFVSCQIAFPSGTWRYKITVEVETPEGIKSGSAVREVFATSSFAFNPDVSSVYHSVSGEAVVVDLGKRGVLFVLIDWDSYNEFFAAFPYRSENLRDEIKHYKGLKVGEKAILTTHCPKMVTFGNLKDPKSVKLVYVNELYADRTHIYEDHFEEIFGAGVKLKQIIIETTDEPVTWEMENKLVWLPYYYDKRLDGDRFGSSSEIANTLSSGAFSTGVKR